MLADSPPPLLTACMMNHRHRVNCKYYLSHRWRTITCLRAPPDMWTLSWLQPLFFPHWRSECHDADVLLRFCCTKQKRVGHTRTKKTRFIACHLRSTPFSSSLFVYSAVFEDCNFISQLDVVVLHCLRTKTNRIHARPRWPLVCRTLNLLWANNNITDITQTSPFCGQCHMKN